MGRKTNSVSLRLKNTNKDFTNCWYGDLLYAYNLSQNLKMQRYLSDIFKTIEVPLHFSLVGGYKKQHLLICYLDLKGNKQIYQKFNPDYTQKERVSSEKKNRSITLSLKKKEGDVFKHCGWLLEKEKKSIWLHLEKSKHEKTTPFLSPETLRKQKREKKNSGALVYPKSKILYRFVPTPLSESNLYFFKEKTNYKGPLGLPSMSCNFSALTCFLKKKNKDLSKNLVEKSGMNLTFDPCFRRPTDFNYSFVEKTKKDLTIKKSKKSNEAWFFKKVEKQNPSLNYMLPFFPLYLQTFLLFDKMYNKGFNPVVSSSSWSYGSPLGGRDLLKSNEKGRPSGSRPVLFDQSTHMHKEKPFFSFFLLDPTLWSSGPEKKTTHELEPSERGWVHVVDPSLKASPLRSPSGPSFFGTELKEETRPQIAFWGLNKEKTLKDKQTRGERHVTGGLDQLDPRRRENKTSFLDRPLKEQRGKDNRVNQGEDLLLNVRPLEAMISMQPDGICANQENVFSQENPFTTSELRSGLHFFLTPRIEKSSFFALSPKYNKNGGSYPIFDRSFCNSYPFYNIVQSLKGFWGNNVCVSLVRSTNEKGSALFLAKTISFFLERKIPFRYIKRQLLLLLSNYKKTRSFFSQENQKKEGLSYKKRKNNNVKEKKMFFSTCLENQSKPVGIRISCSGRVGGRSKKAQRSRKETIMWGETGLHVFSSKLDFAQTSVETPFGLVGIKAWVCYK